MDFGYSISQSAERDRLQVTFADPAFLAVIDLTKVMRVGSRRDAANLVTHYVFPPEVEPAVRAHIAQKEDDIINGPARLAAARAEADARRAAADEKASRAKAAAEKRFAAKVAAADAAGVKIEVSATTLSMPCYAKGAPELLRSAGAKWDAAARKWRFPESASPAIRELVPQLKVLVVQALNGGPSGGGGRRRNSGIGARWGMTDREIVAEIGYLPSSEDAMQSAFGASDY
ncbi:conserved protein of unknown function (plasmid) [Rhodovastum atsumiense]|uniref:Uncharacterized protein n=1 Tax=Rhodovastum atsumiense TaxID=504468 RepID=A0A5M6IU79_9PROT|nr:hypothetical protein [Rhodovastum atsumiense]KAA5611834.1 hypothetical protein F1189_12415 [Rhodovastum atsumiense]CAH2606053.1 conserved protein of unknown function [Rhodovastum atsumiense]